MEKFRELLETAEKNASSDWEKQFTKDFRDRYDKYADTTRISEKQLKALTRIAEGAPKPWK
ncbi:MAG: hypothetical protein ACREA4_00405 [Nitrososphaera sp.]